MCKVWFINSFMEVDSVEGDYLPSWVNDLRKAGNCFKRRGEAVRVRNKIVEILNNESKK